MTQANGLVANAAGGRLRTAGLDPGVSNLDRRGLEPPLFESGRMDRMQQKIFPQLRVRFVNTGRSARAKARR